MNIHGLGAIVDSNGVLIDDNGNPVINGTNAASPNSSWTSFFNTVGNGISNYATAQQTNIGINTVSQVAIVGILVWGAVQIFKKGR